jgi:hypothetical protein
VLESRVVESVPVLESLLATETVLGPESMAGTDSLVALESLLTLESPRWPARALTSAGAEALSGCSGARGRGWTVLRLCNRVAECLSASVPDARAGDTREGMDTAESAVSGCVAPAMSCCSRGAWLAATSRSGAERLQAVSMARAARATLSFDFDPPQVVLRLRSPGTKVISVGCVTSIAWGRRQPSFASPRNRSALAARARKRNIHGPP